MFRNGVFTPVLDLLVLDFKYLLLRYADHQRKISCAIPVLACFIVSPYFFCQRIVLANLLCRQIHTVLVEYGKLFFLPNTKVDLFGQQFLYFCQKALAFEKGVFCRKHVLLVDFSFGNHRTAFADCSIFSRDLFLRPYPFSGLVKVHGAGGDLVIRCFQKPPLGKDQMDVIVGFCLVVVECGSTFHSVLPLEFLGELLQYLIGIILSVILRQGDNQFPCLNTFSLSAASFKLLPAFPCKARPEFGISGVIDGEQVFLSVRTPDIADTPF